MKKYYEYDEETPLNGPNYNTSINRESMPFYPHYIPPLPPKPKEKWQPPFIMNSGRTIETITIH